MTTSKAARKGPSLKPQNFNGGFAWYYESPASIKILTSSGYVGIITVRKLTASLERMGYKVTKRKGPSHGK